MDNLYRPESHLEWYGIKNEVSLYAILSMPPNYYCIYKYIFYLLFKVNELDKYIVYISAIRTRTVSFYQCATCDGLLNLLYDSSHHIEGLNVKSTHKQWNGIACLSFFFVFLSHLNTSRSEEIEIIIFVVCIAIICVLNFLCKKYGDLITCLNA